MVGLGLGIGIRSRALTGDSTAPTITSSASVSLAENTALSHSLTADETVTWSKVGGADTALFTVAGSTLSMTARDYEVPTDANTDNAYVVTVRATDTALNTTDQTITVTITDQDEIPTAFAITDVVGSIISTVNTSDPIVVAGLGSGVSTAISISGNSGTYSKNGGAYTASAGTVVNGDSITARQTSSASDFTATTTTLTIGGVSDTYSVTTQGPELVTNGTGTVTTGWTLTGVSLAANAGTGSGQFQLTSTVASGAQHISRVVSGTVAAGVYRITAIARRGTSTNPLYIVCFSGSQLNAVPDVVSAQTDTAMSFNVTTPGTSFTFFAQIDGTVIGQTGFFDNLSCRRIS